MSELVDQMINTVLSSLKRILLYQIARYVAARSHRYHRSRPTALSPFIPGSCLIRRFNNRPFNCDFPTYPSNDDHASCQVVTLAGNRFSLSPGYQCVNLSGPEDANHGDSASVTLVTVSRQCHVVVASVETCGVGTGAASKSNGYVP